MSTVKILLVGDAAVGKSTWVKRLFTGEFQTFHDNTKGLTVHEQTFGTNYGNVKVIIYDYSGQEKVKDQVFEEYDVVLLFFDLTSKLSFVSLNDYWIKLIKKDTPIILVGNKVDIDAERRTVSDKMIRYFMDVNNIEMFFCMSAKSNFNYEKPILYSVRSTLFPDAQLTESPPVTPPTAST